MPQGNPISGERYLHFKNKLYQVITVATHSETGEALVVYQALYGDFAIYARPLEMFTGQVDTIKYPQVQQKYRFMLVENQKSRAAGNGAEGEKPPADAEGAGKAAERQKPEGAEGAGKAAERQKPEGAEGARKAEEGQPPADAEDAGKAEEKDMTELLMDFYDARGYQEKYNILLAMRHGITDVMINNMAVVLDVVIAEGDIDQRYEELKKCIRTYQKYELRRQ